MLSMLAVSCHQVVLPLCREAVSRRVSREVVSCSRPEVCVVSCHEVVLLSCQS